VTVARSSAHQVALPGAVTLGYIDIYVRRDGAWKIVSVQITKLAAPG
jgi:hypothetical protein